MDGRTCLNAVLELWQEISIKEEQWRGMDSIARGITVSMEGDRVSGSKNQQVMEMATVKMIDFENEINALKSKLIMLQNRIQTVVNRLGFSRLNLVISKRYLCFEDWEKIAEEMRITPRRARQLHQQAVNEFAFQYRLVYGDDPDE